jgi:hypothetical protein
MDGHLRMRRTIVVMCIILALLLHECRLGHKSGFRAVRFFKRQTRPLVREGAPYGQDSNFQPKINIWSWAPDGARHQDRQTDWPSVAKWLWLWLCAILKSCRRTETVKHHAMKMKVHFEAFLTSGLDEAERTASRPWPLCPRNESPVPTGLAAQWTPESVWTPRRITSLPRIAPGLLGSPVQSLYWLSYRCYCWCRIILINLKAILNAPLTQTYYIVTCMRLRVTYERGFGLDELDLLTPYSHNSRL